MKKYKEPFVPCIIKSQDEDKYIEWWDNYDYRWTIDKSKAVIFQNSKDLTFFINNITKCFMDNGEYIEFVYVK